MARNRYFEDEKLEYKFNGKALGKILTFIKPYRRTIIIMIVVMLVMGFVSLVPPIINRYIIDYVLKKESFLGMTWEWAAVFLIAAWFLVGVTEIVYNFIRTFVMSRTGHSIVYDLRNATFNKLQTFAFDYYDTRPAGKILVRVTNYLNEVADIFSSAVVTIIADTAKVLLIIVWLFILDWRLAFVVMASIIPMGVVIYFLRKFLTRRHRIVRNKISNRTAYVAENIQGSFVTKAFNRTKLNTSIYEDLNTDANKSWLKVIRINEFFFPTLDGFFYLGLLAVYAVAIFMSMGALGMGGLTVGKLISFVMYMGMFSAPLNSIANVVQQLSSASTNLERVFEILETEATVKDKEDAFEMPEVIGRVTYEDVTFAYEPGTNILEHFSIDVPPGKMIALVGPTGAGKTTVVNLLSRFYDVSDGRVLIDGTDISDVTLESLRRQVGVMMQDSFVFSGTIMDNIRYARPDATDEMCIRAAKEACAHEFIMRMENGYNTVTREQGAGLSTGERQLLSLARVILSDPRILILDEATSSIDTKTESLVKEALDRVLSGRTSFVIAHRLSTIRKADCILFIADKGIAEAGTHEQLMEKKGRYYDLVRRGNREEE